jgi:branched-chain amino acid transport system substrate-binding protein
MEGKEMRWKSFWGLIPALFSFVLGLASLAKAQETIKIGVYLPMTGILGTYGQMEWEGIQIAHSMEPEALGKKIDLILVDTRSNEIEAANAVTRLVETEKVVGIIGEAITVSTMAGNVVSEKAQIPSISPTAANPLVTQGKAYAFRTCFTDSFQGEVAARFARNNLKAQKAVLIIDVDETHYRPGLDQAQDYRMILARSFEKAFKKLGGSLVSKFHIQIKNKVLSNRFSAELSKLQTLEPHVIYAPHYYTECALIARQVRDSGINSPIVTGDGAYSRELLRAGGKAVENMYFTIHFHKDAVTTERGKTYVKRFEEKFQDRGVDAFGALGADAYFLLVEAVRRGGSVEPVKIRQALTGIRNYQGVSGMINMTENGDPVKSVVITKVEGGKFVYVTTVNP